MAEVKERIASKTRIESLSDLIFGLALSIGALTLIGQPLTDVTSLILSIMYYGFSFLILISVWLGYTRLASHLHKETRVAVDVNVVLLFLVSIEPFLFNQLFNSEISTQYISILYALDLGGLFLVQAVLATVILRMDKAPDVQKHYRLMRFSLLLGAAVFFISVLPIFWAITISLGDDAYVHLTFLIWLIPLFQRPIRNLWERRINRKQ